MNKIFSLLTYLFVTHAMATSPTKEVQLVCENINSRATSSAFGFKQIELSCEKWPKGYDADFKPFKNCQVIYTRHSGIQVTSSAEAYGRWVAKSGYTIGYATILPEVIPAFTHPQAQAFNGFQLEWSSETYPNAMILQACVQTSKSRESKKDGFCAVPIGMRALGMNCVTKFQPAK